MRPELKKRADKLRKSKSLAKKPYKVPKKETWLNSRRRDSDVGQIFRAQYERGVFEANLVNMVSRVEAFIQECMVTVITVYPQKLKILSEGNAGIPLDMFIDNEDRSVLLSQLVASRCESLMFAPPSEYLKRSAKVLSVEISADLVAAYIEIKASRDIVVHGAGVINNFYLGKVARSAARGALGEELKIDRAYLRHVVVTAKALSGRIQVGTETTYG